MFPGRAAVARACEDRAVADDEWAVQADRFADEAYASVKGGVRTYVLHRQLTAHLPVPPGSVLDVGGGAAHRSLPLARLGYDVTVLDSSPAMLDRARERVASEPAEVRRCVRLVRGRGEDAAALVGEAGFDAVTCHGVLMYLDDPEPLVRELCRCARPGGVVSVMALNARTMAVLPAVERRWDDALAAFDATRRTGVLGAETRGDTVESMSALLRANGVEPLAWYGVWWLDLPTEGTDVAAVAAVELAAAARDPYRQLSRVFHLVGRRPG